MSFRVLLERRDTWRACRLLQDIERDLPDN
jgi:hypothetical protein